MILPTSKYWPLKPGTYCDYSAGLITGYWHPGTMELDIWTRVPDPNQGIFRRNVIAHPHVESPRVSIVHSNPPVVATFDMDWTGAYRLDQILWDDGTLPAYIGEYGAGQSISGPPDPVMTVNPVAGERFSTTAMGFQFDSVTGKVSRVSLPVNYGTVATGLVWWDYTGCVRTALCERPGQSGSIVYNYVFAPGIGMIDFWWGAVDANNRVSGNAWKIEGHGP